MLTHRDDSNKDSLDMALTQRGRLFPLSCSGVVVCLGGGELDRCLSDTVQDVALRQNGWVRDGTSVLVEAVQDLCEDAHTTLVVRSLTRMVGHPVGSVRSLVVRLLDAAIPHCEQDAMQGATPAVLSLSNDADMDVKLAALNALCTVVRRARDTDHAIMEDITMQFQLCIDDGSRDLTFEVVRMFARLIPSAPEAMRNGFILECLVNITDQNTAQRSLPRRKEFAAALFDAFRAFDSVYLSEEQTATQLVPGLEMLLADKELLDTFTADLIESKLAELTEPAAAQERSTGPNTLSSGWSLSNFGGKMERSLKKKAAAAAKLLGDQE